jgi:hypothetical protein
MLSTQSLGGAEAADNRVPPLDVFIAAQVDSTTGRAGTIRQLDHIGKIKKVRKLPHLRLRTQHPNDSIADIWSQATRETQSAGAENGCSRSSFLGALKKCFAMPAPA